MKTQDFYGTTQGAWRRTLARIAATGAVAALAACQTNVAHERPIHAGSEGSRRNVQLHDGPSRRVAAAGCPAGLERVPRAHPSTTLRSPVSLSSRACGPRAK